MTTAYIDQTELTSRLGSDGLARLASPIATLDSEATTRISEAATDVNARIDGKIGGLGISVSPTIPPWLIDIAARLVKPVLHRMTWGPRGVPTPQGLIDDGEAAWKELEEIAAGKATVDGSASAAQVASAFSWRDIDNNPSDSNSRETLKRHMRRLP